MFFAKEIRGRLVDIHNHVLPGVDDGSTDMEQSLKMLKIARENGITDIIVTPHYKEGLNNASSDTIRSKMELLQEKAWQAGIDIKLFSGNEVYYFSDIEKKIQKGEILSLNDTDRILIEFSPNISYESMRNAVDTVCSIGYTPILAHVERYGCLLKDIERVITIKQIGAEIQVNTGSVIGKHGKNNYRFVHQLLKQQLVDYIGTDAHNDDSRRPDVKKCYEVLYRKYDTKYANSILYGNAICIINAE